MVIIKAWFRRLRRYLGPWEAGAGPRARAKKMPAGWWRVHTCQNRSESVGSGVGDVYLDKRRTKSHVIAPEQRFKKR